MSQIEADLKELSEFAKRRGATNAVFFKAKDVAVDERVRLKCLVPPCDDYGKNLMCPPYVMSVQEFRDALARYEWAILIQMEAPITAEMKTEIEQAANVAGLYESKKFKDVYEKIFTPTKLKLQEIVNKTEAKASTMGYRFATGFKAGSCKLCPECVVTKPERTCRHPYQSRPSMEAVGIDVFKTAENAGLPFDIPVRGKATWNGLILIN